MKVDKIKEDFSVFNNNPDLVYLDSAATSLKPDVVVDAMTEYYKKYPFSINRGNYKMSVMPTQKYNQTRELIANFLNVAEEEIIFTKSTTASLNHLSHSLEDSLKSGDEIIVSNMEHHSNFIPWQVLCKRLGLTLKIVEAKQNQIHLDDIKELVTPKTKLIAMHHISNVIGNEVDVQGLCEYAKANNIITVIDGAQAAAHIKVDLQKIGCDFYTISGHKILGPTGIGILYINKKFHNIINPFEYGGDMVVPSSVDKDTFIAKNSPNKFEAGTPSIAEVIGLGEAIKYLQKIGMNNIHEHEIMLKIYALELLKDITDMVEIYNGDIKNGILTFNIKGVAVHDAVSESFLNTETFDSNNIALRDGQHCNNLTMKYVIKQKAVLRASFYFYNSKEDVENLVKTIKKIYKVWN